MSKIIAQFLSNTFTFTIKLHKMFLITLIYLSIININTSNLFACGTQIKGTFQTEQFFKFLVKFGFQKSESQSISDSYGYIYGNITSEDNFIKPITLVLLDKHYFIEFYENRNYYDRDQACQKMFSKISTIAFDLKCNQKARTDYFRSIPCKKNSLCIDEDDKSNVIKNNQFTYVVNHPKQPRFWFLTMVSCYRNHTTCQWHYYDASKLTNKVSESSPTINYDIHLVNGSPNTSRLHPLTFQFSFDQQNLLEMYLIFLLVYLVLVPMQFYAVRLQKHPVTRLFTISLFSEFVSLAFITWHYIEFAINGIGEPDFQTIGDILDIFSRTTFMLILLLLAKGWAVTRQQISKIGWIILMSIWIPYCAFHVFLYIWDRTEVDIISDIDEYQTWPGWIVLVLRTCFMMWFLWELRNTMKYEHSTKKLDFLLHLGASSLVWFIYLPIVAIIALQVSPMWRYKLLLGITNSADCLAYCVMTGLLWPNRAGQYLLLAGPNYSGMDELDEFNEAPHIIRERERGSVTTTNSRPSLDSISINNGGQHLITSNEDNYLNGEICIDLLEGDDLDTNLITDLSKNSHVIA